MRTNWLIITGFAMFVWGTFFTAEYTTNQAQKASFMDNIAPKQKPIVNANETFRLILLGTGNPNTTPKAHKPAVALLVDSDVILFDTGGDVLAQWAAYPTLQKLGTSAIRGVYLTHLHSDHVAGLGDVVMTSWVNGNEQHYEPMFVRGPLGTRNLTEQMLRSYSSDIRVRSDGLEPITPLGWNVSAADAKEGETYTTKTSAGNAIEITPFTVKHDIFKQSFGYRINVNGRTAVISGDTIPQDSVSMNCAGCDVLIHEVYSTAVYANMSESWQKYYVQSHTSTEQLAQVATAGKPKLLVLTHHTVNDRVDCSLYLAEMSKYGYTAPLECAMDLDSYSVQ